MIARILGVTAERDNEIFACAILLSGFEPDALALSPELKEAVLPMYRALAALPEDWRRELAWEEILNAQ